MCSSIHPPLSPEWLHRVVIAPYEEGAQRINLAFSGLDPLLFAPPRMSLKARIISLLIGVILMIPLINSIVWVAAETFGNPEKRAAPFEGISTK